MKVFDMQNQEWRQGKLNDGEHFRSKATEQCPVCGCDTDEYVMRIPPKNFYGGGPRLVCPCNTTNPELHYMLERKVALFEEKAHPRNYLIELEEEINELKQRLFEAIRITNNKKGE